MATKQLSNPSIHRLPGSHDLGAHGYVTALQDCKDQGSWSLGEFKGHVDVMVLVRILMFLKILLVFSSSQSMFVRTRKQGV